MEPRTETRRRLLPLIATRQNRHGGRSLMTCQYRCGNQCDHAVANTSDNPYFADVASMAMSRRGLLTAGAAAGLVLSTGGLGAATAAPASSGGAAVGGRIKVPGAIPTLDLGYAPVPPNTLDTVVVPNGCEWGVVIRWGDPVERHALAGLHRRQLAALVLVVGALGVLALLVHGEEARVDHGGAAGAEAVFAAGGQVDGADAHLALRRPGHQQLDALLSGEHVEPFVYLSVKIHVLLSWDLDSNTFVLVWSGQEQLSLISR